MSETPIGCDAFDAQLASYLEGELDFAARRDVERHAGACARCGALLSDLDRIRREAATLGDLAPSRDLWSGIEARIEAPVVPLAPRGAPAVRARRRAWLAAAAAVLVAATSGVTYIATRAWLQGKSTTTVASNSVTPSSTTAAPSAVRGPDTTPTTTAPVSNVSADARKKLSAEQTYDLEISQLTQIVQERRDELDPATVAVIEKNLALIDGAIKESKAALARDPRSRFLNEQLNKALNRKVELLRTVALLPTHT
ncbi:MAG TPA: zf-HC2 domain-containing protein [Gemmatimonadaceae bacterium]|nr:zf-HC2 domain-containing protein [Gemmatimonadaceae bacterium]